MEANNTNSDYFSFTGLDILYKILGYVIYEKRQAAKDIADEEVRNQRRQRIKDFASVSLVSVKFRKTAYDLFPFYNFNFEVIDGTKDISFIYKLILERKMDPKGDGGYVIEWSISKRCIGLFYFSLYYTGMFFRDGCLLKLKDAIKIGEFEVLYLLINDKFKVWRMDDVLIEFRWIIKRGI